MSEGKAIPQEFIRDYVDQLLVLARKLPVESAMYNATLLRADHAMDLVKSWREKEAREGR